MRKMSLFALLMLLVLATAVFAQASPGSPGAPGIGDPLYPGFGNGGYDVQHYTLDLTADPKSGSLSGDVSLDVQATQDLSSFNLDLIGFDIRAITVNGTDAAFSRDGQELTITPAQPIASGAAFTVEVRYKGVPDNVTSVALPVQTGWVPYNDLSNCPCSFVLSEPDGAADFFPANDHPLDKATYTLRVTVPKPYQVALNGVLKQIIDNGSTTTTVSEVSAPMASYLVTIDISQFDLVTDSGSALSAGGVPIRNYFEVGVDDATRHLFDRQPDMISYFETLFGKYPFDVYGSVMLNTETGGALEAQTLSIFGTDTVSTDYSDSEVTIAHELAHQWFGDSVSVADWRDIWLNESFATYAEGLWIEHSENAAALDAWVQDNYDYVAGDDTIVPPGSPNADDLFNDGVYYRGALALHALRLRVGDDPFFRILQTWASRYQYSNATTADFIALATEISGMDLSQFFQDWLYGVELPPIPEMNLGT